MAESRERRRETIKEAVRRPILNYFEENDLEIQEKVEGMVIKSVGREGADETAKILERVQRRNHGKCETIKRGEDISVEKYSQWRQEQKTRAGRLEKQLRASWELEELIEDQLNRFRAHYNHAMVPTQLKDVAEILMPKWTPPHELAALSWLGDWRPSSILDLVRGLNRSSPSISSSVSDSSGNGRLLSQVMHEIRIEEAIIEEEMAEIQAKCVLHLHFTPLNKKKSSRSSLGFIQKEFKKIERVIIKAQHLRFKALELVVKKVLSQRDAVEFFVAFEGIQDAIHQVAEQQKSKKVLVTVPVRALGCS